MREIERGRHTQPISPTEKRHCPEYNVTEIEIHFVLGCSINQNEMLELFAKCKVWIHASKICFRKINSFTE